MRKRASRSRGRWRRSRSGSGRPRSSNPNVFLPHTLMCSGPPGLAVPMKICLIRIIRRMRLAHGKCRFPQRLGEVAWSRRVAAALNDLIERHLGPPCERAGIAFAQLGDEIGEHVGVLWGCMLEDFLAGDGSKQSRQLDQVADLSKPQAARKNRDRAAVLVRRETCPRLSAIPVHTID